MEFPAQSRYNDFRRSGDVMSIHSRVISAWALLVGLAGCQAGGGGELRMQPFPSDARVAVLRVNGMSCPLCAHNINLQLHDLPGVRGVHVDLGKGLVTVAMANSFPPSEQQLTKAIRDSGFSLVGIDMTDGASKMLCSTCDCTHCSCVLAARRCGPACSCKS
jgi:copper chaperone CopZ